MYNRFSSITSFLILLSFLVGCATSPRYTRGRKAVRPSVHTKKKTKTYSEKPTGKHALIGTASYYGPGFHGKKTANGERFNMYELTIKTSFSAAHNLRDYCGKCENLHGHNWLVEVKVKAKNLDKTGLAIDFKILKQKIGDTLAGIDHHYLNELPYFRDKNPSSENIAFFLFFRLKEQLEDGNISMSKVTVWESNDACASYYEDL